MKTERKKRNCNVVENCRKKNSTLFNTEEELKHAEISEHGVGDPRQTKLSLFILLWFLISYFILTFSNRDLFSLLTFLSFTVCCYVENLFFFFWYSIWIMKCRLKFTVHWIAMNLMSVILVFFLLDITPITNISHIVLIFFKTKHITRQKLHFSLII
jgi:hypothetical protein